MSSLQFEKSSRSQCLNSNPLKLLLTLAQIEFPFEILMLIGYALIKLSIIYFLRRLFVVGKTGHFNIITLSMVTIVVLWLITFLGLFIFGCKSHVDYHWGNLAQISSSCYHPFRQELGMAFSDLILDILIFILPFPMVGDVWFADQKMSADLSL